MLHATVQCQTSRDIQFEKKSQNIIELSIPVYIFIPFYPIIGDINITEITTNQEIAGTFILHTIF